MFCKYFLLVYGSSSYSLHCLLQSRNLILTTLHLPIFSFMDGAFVVVYKKSLLNLKLIRFSLVLSSRSFIVFHIAFRAMIHFELIFEKGVKSVSRFLFLNVDVCHSHIIFEATILLLLNCLCSFVRDQFTQTV